MANSHKVENYKPALQVKWHVFKQAFQDMKKNLDENANNYEQKWTNWELQEETKGVYWT